MIIFAFSAPSAGFYILLAAGVLKTRFYIFTIFMWVEALAMFFVLLTNFKATDPARRNKTVGVSNTTSGENPPSSQAGIVTITTAAN